MNIGIWYEVHKTSDAFFLSKEGGAARVVGHCSAGLLCVLDISEFFAERLDPEQLNGKSPASQSAGREFKPWSGHNFFSSLISILMT